ncbi:MAB_1171c family putative transporter [Streptomyces mirabilis]|uniref:MAB_1171c family putative transporter n=1 Tax=Streptomyces mirabilis TaxID=68239 RepID=UPI0036AB017A
MTATPDLFTLAVIALSLECFRRLPSALRNDKSRALWAFLAVTDIALATRITSVADFVAQITGVDDATMLAQHISRFASVALMLQWVTAVVPGRMDGKREPRYRRVISNRPRRVVTWAAAIASVILFPQASRYVDGDGGGDYIYQQAGHFWGSLHLILFYAYMAFGTTCASMMLAAASRDPKSKGAFKLGMHGMAIGCSIGAMYAILRTGYLVVRLFNKPFLGGDGFVSVFSYFALSTFALLMIAGSSAPMWERMAGRMETHAAINDLRPMWCILTYAVPSVVYRSRREQWVIRVLAPQAPDMTKRVCRTIRALADFWNWSNVDRRLHRRVTEICDAAMRLKAYLPVDLRDESTTVADELGLPDHAIRAYLLHTAMHLKKNGTEPHSRNPGCPILEPTDEALATTAMLLPIGKAMANPVLMAKFHRRLATV